MLNKKIEFRPLPERISFKRIILTLIGSFFAYGLFDNSISRALAEYGFAVKLSGELLFQYSNWYILTVVLSGATAGFLAGAVIRKQGKLYGAFPCLAWLVVVFGSFVFLLHTAGYCFGEVVEEWRGAELVWDWYSFTHGILAVFTYGIIAGSIGGHFGEKIAKRHQVEGRTEEDSLILFLFAPKARTILTTLLLVDCISLSVLAIITELTILKWWTIGSFFVLSHFSSLFGPGAFLGVLSALSFSILLAPFFAPFFFKNWWNLQKTKLRKAGIYILFLIALPIALWTGSFLTYWGIGSVLQSAGEQGIHLWGILLDHRTRSDYYFVLSKYYKTEDQEVKSYEYLKMSTDELMKQAEAKFQVDQFSDGITKLERIIEQDVDHVRAHLMLGEIYLEEFGDIQRATSYFEEAFQIVPQDSADEIYLVDACIKLGEIYLEDVADTQRAIVYFKKALEISPEDPFAVIQLLDTYLRLGIHCLEAIGDNQKAITYFKGALEILPEDPEVLYYLGLAYREVDMSKSKHYLQKTIEYGSSDSLYEDIVQNAKEILLEYSK